MFDKTHRFRYIDPAALGSRPPTRCGCRETLPVTNPGFADMVHDIIGVIHIFLRTIRIHKTAKVQPPQGHIEPIETRVHFDLAQSQASGLHRPRMLPDGRSEAYAVMAFQIGGVGQDQITATISDE